MKVSQLRTLGFTQRRPKEPGIYFVAVDEHCGRHTPHRHTEGWDVANIYFTHSLSVSAPYDSHGEEGWWCMTTLDGITKAWRKGMWTKGPISPRSAPVSG